MTDGERDPADEQIADHRRTQRELAQTRDLLRGVLSGARRQSIIATDPHGRITLFSEGARRMTGFAPEEMLGKCLLTLHDPAEIAVRANELGTPVGLAVLVGGSNGDASTREWTYLISGGGRLTVLLTVTPNNDAFGGLIGYVAVASDITSRTIAEGWLRESEERFRLAFDDAPIGIALMGLRAPGSGRLLQVNRALCELLGRAQSDLTGARECDITHPDDVALSVHLLDNLVEGQMSRWDGDKRYVHALGHEIWVHLSITVVRDVHGSPSHTVSHFVDITDRKQAVARLEEQFGELADNVNSGFTLHQIHPPSTLYVNPACYEIFGFDRAGPTPTTADVLARFHPDDRSAAVKAIARLRRGHRVSGELRIVRPDGELRWVCVRLSPVGATDGVAARIAGLYEDVTERRQADAALRESDERFNQMADNTDVGFFLRESRNMIYMNLGFMRIFGIDPALVQPSSPDLLACFHPDDRAKAKRIGELTELGRSTRDELRIVRPDAEVRWLRIINDPVLDPTGTTTRVAGTVEDITDRKIAEADVLAAQAEAEGANAAKDEFLSRMSHELRTPLNAVLGFAQLLELDALSFSQQDAVGHILRGGKHLLAMIDDVLDIASIESNRLHPALEAVHVGQLVGETIGLMQPLAATTGVEIRFDPDQRHADRYVRADRRRFRQVLLNLLSNAVKYNRTGGLVDIGVVRADDRQLSITVTDTGIGIASGDLPRLFRPFERLGHQSSDIDGTGIGLALSRRLTNVMHGRLDVESVEGHGSTFTVTLPLTERAATTTSAPTDLADPPVEHTARSTVLYIEDNCSNVDLVAGILRRRAGWTMTHARTGTLGLLRAAADPPTVILLDLHLPDVDGIDVLRTLRAEPATADVPVAILSADAGPTQIRRLLAAGAATYLTKPLDVRKVLAFLDTHAR